MNTFVIIPALNEGQRIATVVEQVRQRYPQVVVIDDGSDDGTGMTAAQAGAIVLTHEINRGQGASLKTGIVYALEHDAEAIVTFDADGQHNADDIDRLLQPIQDGRADIVLGSRFLENTAENMPLLRKVMLRAAVIFTRFASGLNVTDTHNGLRALTRDAAHRIKIHQDRMAHASEILDEINRNQLRFVEVPVTIHYSAYSTEKGQSTMAFGKVLFKYIIGRLMR
ncbi:MAG: glycosyltransferase family 2 protein [Candidatus Kerfeldbacteria bacterium]|nr:glycosyltransferase family 2 protein [Candidatus Kerfeldbacteria bacterium]